MPETDNDPSGSTAMFRAFAQESENDVRRGRRASSSSRTIIITGVVVACVVVLAVILGLVL
jgi:hypothetical protein